MKDWKKTVYDHGFRGILLIFLLCTLGLGGQIYMEENFNIYNTALRFHVRADSDEKEEQNLKLRVRDAVLSFIENDVQEADNAGKLYQQLGKKTEKIRREAAKTICGRGYERKIRVFMTKERFPLRIYGNVIFPAGEYRALRVDLGRAKGHNWWCAIYPELCYNAEETFVMSKKGRKDLERELSGWEKKILSGKKNPWCLRILRWFSKE